MREQFERFSVYISGIYRSIQKLEREEMVKYSLTGAYAQYLVAMARFPDGITATELCEVCEKDKAAVSRIIANMETKGLVMRKGRNSTSYRARLILTDEGRKAAHFVNERARLAVKKAEIGLSENEITLFYETLALIASNLQNISKEGLPETDDILTES